MYRHFDMQIKNDKRGDYMKLLFISLGCDKNLVDSEVMLGELSKRGYSFTEDETEAEIIVINTCCFINDAKEESINLHPCCPDVPQCRRTADTGNGWLASRWNHLGHSSAEIPHDSPGRCQNV